MEPSNLNERETIMSRLIIDFRFVEIEHELWALAEYNRTLESHLPTLKTQEQQRLQQRIRDQQLDESDASIEYQEHYHLIEDVLPRFFYSPVLVTLWAIYESAVTEIADYIKKQRKLALGVRDITGKNTFDRLQKYFDHYLGFPLVTTDQARERLQMLLALRNALAHANGRKDAVGREQWHKIEQWRKAHAGIITTHDNLMFAAEFVDETLALVGHSLRDLIERTRQTY